MHTPELSSLENNQNKSHVVTAAVPSEFSQDFRDKSTNENEFVEICYNIHFKCYNESIKEEISKSDQNLIKKCCRKSLAGF